MVLGVVLVRVQDAEETPKYEPRALVRNRSPVIMSTEKFERKSLKQTMIVG